MNSWLTVHLAHPDNHSILWHIFLKEEHRFLCDEIQIGDSVFFYEAKGGYGHARKGAEGIIRIAVVSGEPYERVDEKLAKPDNEGAWGIGIPTDIIHASGYVPREQVNHVMGYASNYVFVGYNRGKGIKLLKPHQAHALLDAYTSYP